MEKLQHHYRPQHGWVNDPNGLVYFDGYYHVFYQHAPDFETPWHQPMHWGHARTKDFLTWEELPVALTPGETYDRGGCWSGTATVRDGVLYLFYASVVPNEDPACPNKWVQTVSMAYSTDGVHFTKYEKNPVIAHYPADGCPDFRDPAVACIDGEYYIVMASGHEATKTARLLLYRSADMRTWEYAGVMSAWENCRFAECPSFVPFGEKYLLAASVCPLDRRHYFTLSVGDFAGGVFTPECTAMLDRGPDQYAGQVFTDARGRAILISWTPGWAYAGYAETDVGCMSIPREITVRDGKIYAQPVEEVRHLFTDSDPAVQRTETGFIIERCGREPVIYEGDVRQLQILRDGYLIEVFVNGGEEVYTALL